MQDLSLYFLRFVTTISLVHRKILQLSLTRHKFRINFEHVSQLEDRSITCSHVTIRALLEKGELKNI